MTAKTSGYTLRVVNGNQWRIYHDKNPKHLKDGEGMIHQYYFNENASSVRKLAPGQGIQKSFPHHHCLMKASLSSTQTLLRDKCLHRSYARTAYAFQPEWIISSTDALARIHAVKETSFTELTEYQKKYLITQSAMAGILITRLFGFSSAKPHTVRWLKKHADLTANYIHSALVCEYLIGNRYYYNLPAVLSQEKSNVGHLPIEKILRNIKAEDATYDKIKENRAQLVELYHLNIERLEDAVKQFRRGFLSIQTIREDSEYKKMLEMFWMLQTQCMKYRNVSESSMSARQTFCERNNVTFDRRAIQVMVCNLVFSCQVICPKLFAYEIVHLFDDCSGVYAKYVEVTRAKHLEMCSQGLTSAFLTFSAIEPNMVSTALAPHMKECDAYYPSDFSEHACYIPSRDAIFGPLLSKHRIHIPRPVNIARTFFMTRHNKDCFYLPMQEALTELRTGKKVAKQVWKKNKQNFTRKY